MSTPTPIHSVAALERMVHLNGRICEMWATNELDSFIDHLIMDARDGARQGLPVEVGRELMFLQDVNKIVRAINIACKQRISYNDALHMVNEIDLRNYESASPYDDPLSGTVPERGAERQPAVQPPPRPTPAQVRAQVRDESNGGWNIIHYIAILIAALLTIALFGKQIRLIFSLFF